MNMTTKGLVASARLEANEIGEAIFGEGGNAVDAAVAASLAIGVAEPYMGGVGGVGEIVVRDESGTIHVVDCAARAPLAARPDLYEIVGEATGLYAWPAVKDDRNIYGQLAVTAPQLLNGLKAAHERFGRLAWKDVVAPAAKLAREGVPMDHFSAAVIAHEMETFSRDALAAALYYPGGRPAKPPIDGNPELVRNDALADTLSLLAEDGAAALAPDGPLTQSILSSLPEGILSKEDFRFNASDRVLSGVAALTTFKGWLIHGSPLPSGSMTVVQILDELSRRQDSPGVDSPARYEAVAAASLAAFDIRLERQRPAMSDATAKTGTPTATTHVSSVDSDGMAASVTQSLLSLFGSQVGVVERGFFLNNGMMWFDPRQGRRASIASGARAMMAISPILAIDKRSGKLISVGALGARRIITAVAQALDNAISYGDSLQAAVNRPRVHADGIGPVLVDHRLGEDVRAHLVDKVGPTETAYYGPTSLNFARASAVGFDPRDKRLEKGIDLRAQSVWTMGETP